jgi:hypothetical protein
MVEARAEGVFNALQVELFQPSEKILMQRWGRRMNLATSLIGAPFVPLLFHPIYEDGKFGRQIFWPIQFLF